MTEMILTAPTHFGLEAVCKREIYDLGYEVTEVTDGRVTFAGDEEAIVRANLGLRTAERVMLQAGAFRAETFDALFEQVKALPWEQYIPEDGRFWVKKAASVKSRLFSPRDIQSIVKKAIVERLKMVYHREWFEETGAPFPLRVFINKDQVLIGIDTSGESLHKRGYRTAAGMAPISETMAAGLILLTPWKKDRILLDPFCGSGTIAIEAAMMAARIPAGWNRSFLAEAWTHLIPQTLWEEVREEAREEICTDLKTDIQGYDIDDAVVAIARDNAKRAGVEKLIHFQQRPAAQMSHHGKYGFLISNPPYGERLENEDTLPEIYREIGEGFRRLEAWSMYLITGYEKAPDYIGIKPTKNRKLYNGMIKTYLYQYEGPKPPKRQSRMEL